MTLLLPKPVPLGKVRAEVTATTLAAPGALCPDHPHPTRSVALLAPFPSQIGYEMLFDARAQALQDLAANAHSKCHSSLQHTTKNAKELAARLTQCIIKHQLFRRQFEGYKHMRSLAICTMAVLLIGCAGVSHKAIPYTPISARTSRDNAEKANAAADAKATGIRYYQTSPYLLVYSDGRGGIGWKIYYLPDQTRKMSAEPYNVFSKVKSDLTFSNGMLADSTADVDATTLPKGIISAVEKLLPSLLAAADQPPHEIPPPRLYKVTVQRNQVVLSGGPGDQTIKVTGSTEK